MIIRNQNVFHVINALILMERDSINEFLELANKLLEESRKESGCREYQLYQDINNPQILTFIEKWADEKAIAEHNQTKHFTAIMPKLKGFEEMPMDVNLYKAV